MELPIKSPKSKTGRRRAAARPEVTVAWPKGLLYPDTTYSIRLTIPPEITKLQIKCDFQDKYLWLTGPGKLAHANDFVCQAPAVGGNWQVELTLGIRPPEKPCLEPVSLALFDGEGELVGESVGQLSITPAAEAPELLHPLLKGLAWLMGTEPGKPMLVRVAHVLGRLALLTVVAAGVHYLKAPHPLLQLQTDFSRSPVPVTIRLDPNNMPPFEDFYRTQETEIKREWGMPDAWNFEQGFGIDKNDPALERPDPRDGKLRLIGPGVATYPKRFALYDFELEMVVELVPQGSATWIVRAQPGSGGYRFTITNKQDKLFLSASAFGVRRLLFFETAYNLLDYMESERLIVLPEPCCSTANRIQVQIRAKDFTISHRFTLEKLDGTSSGEDHPDVELEDTRHTFRYGGFQVVADSPGRGPAYEFIHMVEAGIGLAPPEGKK